MAEHRAAKDARIGPSELKVVKRPEATIVEARKMVSEDSTESDRVERKLVISAKEFPPVVGEEIPPATSEDREAMLLSSKNEGNSQHCAEGDAGEEYGAGEEIQTTVGGERSPVVPDLKRKRVKEKHPMFHIQEVQDLSINSFYVQLLSLYVLHASRALMSAVRERINNFIELSKEEAELGLVAN